MTEQEILTLTVLDNDNQLNQAISYLDVYLTNGIDLEDPNFNKLSDLIEEYEDRTNILNRAMLAKIAKKSLEMSWEDDND